MVKLAVCLTLALAACGGGSNKPADAAIDSPDASPPDAAIDAPPMYDFTCSTNPEPTTANAMVMIAGTVTEIGLQGTTPTFKMLSGATVDACTGNCAGPNKLATATTDASGAFTDGPFATGGTPVDGYLHLKYMTDEEVFAYPAVPVTKDVASVPVLTFTPAIVQAFILFGCNQKTTNGIVVLAATDCTDTRIKDFANVTVSVKQAGVGVGDPPISLGGISASAAGLFAVCNVPPGTTTVGATYKSQTLLAHDVVVTVGTMTSTASETEVRPGYY